jgi:recombination protein RecR
MGFYAQPIEVLIHELGKLPGIGNKTAQRLAFHIINMPQEDAKKMADAIIHATEKIGYCKECFNITDQELCNICSNPKRDQSIICVVSKSKDIHAIEKMKDFNGVYHVLHGVISPIDGIGPDDIKLKELIHRVKNNETKEIIVATNPDVEGEATAIYIAKLLQPLGITVTRPAKGIPIGADLEFADEITLLKAFEGRKPL